MIVNDLHHFHRFRVQSHASNVSILKLVVRNLVKHNLLLDIWKQNVIRLQLRKTRINHL
jgi:hypothetical protein